VMDHVRANKTRAACDEKIHFFEQQRRQDAKIFLYSEHGEFHL
jgi:hypothetical protein